MAHQHINASYYGITDIRRKREKQFEETDSSVQFFFFTTGLMSDA